MKQLYYHYYCIIYYTNIGILVQKWYKELYRIHQVVDRWLATVTEVMHSYYS